MSEVENMPPTATNPADRMGPLKSDQKQPVKSASKGKIGSDRKKLQTLQPSGKNQTLLVGADGQLRLGGSGKKEPVKIFVDPETPKATTPTTPKPTSSETGVQVSPKLSEGSSQVEKADVAQAKAEEQMYCAAEEELGVDYWRDLAEKRREALETSLIENEELHTSLLEVEEEKEAVEKERDSLKEMAEQAEQLAKIVKELVDDKDDSDEEETVENHGEEGKSNEESSGSRTEEAAE